MIWFYLIFFGFLGIGLLYKHDILNRMAEKGVLLFSTILIFLFGIQLGEVNQADLSRYADLVSALVLALAVVIGSVLATLLVYRLGQRLRFAPFPVARDAEVDRNHSINPWVTMIISLFIWCTGILMGIFLQCQTHFVLDLPTPLFIRWVLFLMIACIGYLCAAQLHVMRRDRSFSNWKALAGWYLLIPGAIMTGSIVAAALIGPLVGVHRLEAMICAAPMGWQTMGGPLVQELRGVRLGNMAFSVNMFRDILALIIIPIVARRRYEILAVAPGGVSTMDILLPTVLSTAGREYLLLAIWVGGSCALWAPILTTILAGM